jgi:hypothetical protein
MDAGTIPPGSLIRAIDQPGAPIDVVENRYILGFRRQKIEINYYATHFIN